MGDDDVTGIVKEATDSINEVRGERIRVNAKANSKGEYVFDATFEETSGAPEPVDVDRATCKVLDAVELLRRKFKANSFPVAGQ